MLKIDNTFTPCPVADGDELFPNGIFEFNITKMIEYIKNNLDHISLEKVVVNDFFKEFSSINESHLNSVKLSKPVILAEISPEQYNLIDGHHRMEKARRTGRKILSAYKLNVTQHVRFLISRKGYVAFGEYWNDKLKTMHKER